eukprot:c37540_g1_i1 orf=291-497(+)
MNSDLSNYIICKSEKKNRMHNISTPILSHMQTRKEKQNVQYFYTHMNVKQACLISMCTHNKAARINQN